MVDRQFLPLTETLGWFRRKKPDRFVQFSRAHVLPCPCRVAQQCSQLLIILFCQQIEKLVCD